MAVTLAPGPVTVGQGMDVPFLPRNVTMGVTPLAVTKDRNGPVGPQAVTRVQGMDTFLLPHWEPEQRPCPEAVSLGEGRDVPNSPGRGTELLSGPGVVTVGKGMDKPCRSPGCPPTPTMAPRAVTVQGDKQHP